MLEVIIYRGATKEDDAVSAELEKCIKDHLPEVPVHLQRMTSMFTYISVGWLDKSKAYNNGKTYFM